MNEKALDKERKQTAERIKGIVKYKKQMIQIGPRHPTYFFGVGTIFTATKICNFKLKVVTTCNGGGLSKNFHKVISICENGGVAK